MAAAVLAAVLTGLRLALGLLTIIPVTPPEQITSTTARRAMLLAPLAVAPLAVAAALLGRLMIIIGLPPLVAGLVAVATLAAGTRALHLDGLADTVDGLGSGREREAALAIMKRGDVGPMGVVALVVVLALQAALLGSLLSSAWGGLECVLVIMASRACLGLVCRAGVPAATGSTLGALVAATVSRTAAWVSWAVWVVVLIAVRILTAPGLSLPFLPAPTLPEPIATVLGALLATGILLALIRRVVRRLGGVTGDVMGAAVELVLTALLLGTVATLPQLS